MTKSKFRVYGGVVNYTIELDENNRVYALRLGAVEYYFRSCFGKDDIDRDTLKVAFKYLMIEEPKKFQELYRLLKENDSEMFEHLTEVVENLKEFLGSIK